jgi:hypothetical protein
MILIVGLINHSVNGNVNMRKIKKAQLGHEIGDHLVKRKSQDDRIHRIEKKDPERAQRVADRVQKRALRSVKPSSVKPPSKMFIPLRERAKAANERKAAAKAPKAQSGDSLIYESKGVRYPKRRIAVDTAGYAGGKKSFKATSKYLEDLGGRPKEYPEKSKKYGRSVVKAILKTKGVAAPKKKAGGKVSKKIVKK